MHMVDNRVMHSKWDYVEVAKVYREGGVTPVMKVAETFSVSKSAAAKAIQRAREKGLIPATSRGVRTISSQEMSAQRLMIELNGRLFARVSEVAKILEVDPRTVRRGIEEGSIPAVRIGDTVRIPVGRLREALGLSDGTLTKGPHASKHLRPPQ